MSTNVREKVDRAGALQRGFSLISDARLRQLYSGMLKCRALATHFRLRVDRRARDGEHSSDRFVGSEASAVGAVMNLRLTDTISPPPGDFMASLIKGAPLESILALLAAESARPRQGERSASRLKASSRLAGDGLARVNILPASATKDMQFGVAAGVAFAYKSQGKGNVVLAFGEENSMSPNDPQEAMTMAGAHQLPILFIQQSRVLSAANSIKRKPETRHLSIQTEALGFPTILVDGEDVVAIYRVAYECIARARQGGGPTLIQCMVHTRERATGEAADRHDPIYMMEQYLTRKDLFTSKWKQKVLDEFNAQVLDTIEHVWQIPPGPRLSNALAGRVSGRARL